MHPSRSATTEPTGTSIPGWTLELHDSLPSTQRALEERMAIAPRDRHVIIAAEQSAGRARRGNRWESPRGGLWCSFSLGGRARPDPFLSLVVALAARDALSELLPPARLGLKWPNDLVAGGRKWGGLLSTTHACGGRWNLLFGLGLNLDIPARALADVEPPATSLRAEFGRSPSPLEALPRILSRLDAYLAADEERGREPLRARVASSLVTLGRNISWQEVAGAERGARPRRGRALSLEADGGLRVRLEDGSEITLRNGPVHHVRALP